MARIKGNEFANRLTGTDMDDFIFGFAGNDELFGGRGNDYLNGGDGSDFVSGGTGHDTLLGGSGDDYLSDVRGNNSFDGGDGFDTISYDTIRRGIHYNAETGIVLKPNDRSDIIANIENVVGSRHDDVMVGSISRDVFNGSYGDDNLSGGDGEDSLHGNEGSDRLDGGAGFDWLYGGEGADVYVFTNADISDVDYAEIDLANDTGLTEYVSFSAGSGDVIDLQGIDADISTVADEAFIFIGTAAFSGIAGELRAFTSERSQLLLADVDGDGVANLAIRTISLVTIGDLVL